MIASRGAGAPCGGSGELIRMCSGFLAGYCGRLHLARLHFASSSRTRSKGGKALECARFLGRPAGIFKSVAGCLVSRERSTQPNAYKSHDFVQCDLPHVDLRCSGPSLCRGQEAQDNETLEANTHAAQNRCADNHRRAGGDRTRNRYHNCAHLGYVRPRVCPPSSVLVAGWSWVSAGIGTNAKRNGFPWAKKTEPRETQ
jgi:hypothetical protein